MTTISWTRVRTERREWFKAKANPFFKIRTFKGEEVWKRAKLLLVLLPKKKVHSKSRNPLVELIRLWQVEDMNLHQTNLHQASQLKQVITFRHCQIKATFFKRMRLVKVLIHNSLTILPLSGYTMISKRREVIILVLSTPQLKRALKLLMII